MTDDLQRALDAVSDWLTVTDAAARRGVSVETMRRWARDGWVRAVLLGRDWRIDPASLDAFTPPKPGPKVEKEGSGDEQEAE